jgi:nitrite reductase/ring-hydroxylating ferredoxin subunit
MSDQRIALCASADLRDGGLAIPFDVVFGGQTCRAFAVRYQGGVHAYINRCSHVALELDWQPNKVFDASGQHLLCANHGAVFAPDTGACLGGPGRGPLHKIDCTEDGGTVYWHTAWNLRPSLL